MYQLTIEDSAGDVIVVPLQHEQISIGREKGNVVRLTDQNISRNHARLLREDGRYFVEDLSSFLGTSVNGVPITARTLLDDGDRVAIGDYRLTVARADAAVPPKQAAPARRRVSVAAVTAWARIAFARAAGLLSRWKGFWGARKAPALQTLGSLASLMSVAVADGGPGSLALGLPMVSDGGSSTPPPGGGDGGPPGRHAGTFTPLGGPSTPPPSATESGPIGRASPGYSIMDRPTLERPVSLVVPPVLPPPPAPFGSGVGKRILRLRGTLILGLVAVIMVIVGVVFAPPRDGKGGLASVRNALPKSASGVETPGGLLEQARAAYSKGRWEDTLLLLTRATVLSPGLKDAESLRRATLAERKNQAAIQAAERALDLENYGLVLEQVASVSAQSAYRDRASVLGAAARANLVAQHLSTAQGRQAAGDCRVAAKEAQAALALEPDNPTAKELLARCPRAMASRASASGGGRKLAAVSRAAPKPDPVPEARRVLVGTSDGVLPPIFSSPLEKSSRRPIEPSNPYAGDLR